MKPTIIHGMASFNFITDMWAYKKIASWSLYKKPYTQKV